jgi:membrane-associated protease RseP (regulator of RpoE activity)
MTHVMSILDRWKQGEDLLPGKLGVGLVAGPTAIAAPKISTVWPGSPAAVAGWKADDLIVSINGQPIKTQAQLRFQVVPHYADDIVTATIQRGEEKIESEITLAGEMAPYQHAFLGVLPGGIVKSEGADESEEVDGILVRNVWPNSPAAEAGLQAGDVLKSINDKRLKSLKEAYAAIDTLQPKRAAKLVVARDERELTLSADLSELPKQILSREQLKSSGRNQEIETEAKLESLKFVALSLAAKFYDPNPRSEQAKGMLLWLGEGDEADDQQLLDAWQKICRQNEMVLLIAHPSGETGWTSEDLAHLDKLAGMARRRWQLDPERTVIGGFEKAGQLAYALAFAKRKDFSGVIGIDAPLPRSLQIPANRPGIRLAILAVQSEDSTFAPLIRNDLERLDEAGYPACWLETPAGNDDQSVLEPEVIDSLGRWIDGLDRF